MRSASKIQALLLLAVFAFFYCGNALFMHTHILDGNTMVVHSHPYLPSGHHSHSSQALESIAGFNAALLSMQAGEEIHCEPMQAPCYSIACAPETGSPSTKASLLLIPRAPPTV